jgi:hypothetical protein
MENTTKFEQEFDNITTPMMIYEFQVDKFNVGDAYAICKVIEDRDKVTELLLLHGILLGKAIDKLTFVVAATDRSEAFIKNTVSGRFSAPIGDNHYTFDISPADLKKHELYIKPLRLINIERGVMYE